MARIVFAPVVALCALLVSQPVFAMDGMPPMKHMRHGDMALMTRPPMDGSCPTPRYYIENRDAIGLSDAQLADLRKLDFELTRGKLVKGAAVKALELELTEIVTDPAFSVDAALSKLSDIEKARMDLRTEVIKAAARARDFLDAGQKAALKELLLELPPSGRSRTETDEEPGPGMDKEELKERMMREMMQKKMP